MDSENVEPVKGYQYRVNTMIARCLEHAAANLRKSRDGTPEAVETERNDALLAMRMSLEMMGVYVEKLVGPSEDQG